MIIVEDEDVEKLRKLGFTVLDEDGKNARKVKSDSELLKDILETLGAILRKPDSPPSPPQITVTPPAVIVKPVDVTVVSDPPAPPITKWSFDLYRGQDGKLKRIVATAAD